MLVGKTKYELGEIQKLADLVKMYHGLEQPIDYEIIVDGLKVVRRTSNPEMFFQFEKFVSADSKAVEILLYNGNSNVNERRVFTFQDEPATSALDGFETNEKFQSQLAAHKKELLGEIRREQLEKDNESMKAEIAGLEAEVEKLEKLNGDLLNHNSPLRGFLGEFGSSFVESFIRRNPKIIKSIPGGEALAGLLETEPNNNGEAQHDTEVSFQPKANPLSEDEKMAITFVNQLKLQFSKDEFDKILLVLQDFAGDKTKIDRFLTEQKLS